MESRLTSQYFVIGRTVHQLHNEGRVGPTRWCRRRRPWRCWDGPISASAWRSASKRAMTLLAIATVSDNLERNHATHGLLLFGTINHAHAADNQYVRSVCKARSANREYRGKVHRKQGRWRHPR